MMYRILVQIFQNSGSDKILPEQISDKIKPIEIPIFPIVVEGFDPKYSTILSWLSFAGVILTIIVLAIFIVRIVFLSYKMIVQGSEKEEVVGDVFKKFRLNFVGLIITFLTPIILSLIGGFLGIGNIFRWPKMFSSCSGSEYEFYFEAYLREGTDADNLCFTN